MERALLLIPLLAAVLASADCDSEGAPAGPPTVAVEPRLEEGAAAYVRSLASSLAPALDVSVGVSGDRAAEPQGAAVLIDSRAPAEGDALAVTVRFWGAFANFWSPAESVSLEGLRRAAAGQVADWSDLGAPAGPLTTYLPLELRGGLERLLGPLPAAATTSGRWVRRSEAAARVAADQGALALLP